MRYEEHEVFSPPEDPNAVIWRYMDFTKLVALLDSASLYFARADRLGDEFEGSYSRATVELRSKIYEDIPQTALAQISQTTAGMLRHTYVKCWSVSPVESAALWGLYVPPSGGVAIRSTFQRLVDALVVPEGDHEPSMGRTIFVGMVRYADYDSERMPEGNTMWPFVYKRHSFEFERELRAVIQNLPTVPDRTLEGGKRVDLSQPSPPGRAVEVDLPSLVEAIHVSPVAPGWFLDLVTSVCARYDLDKRVVQSSLAAGRSVHGCPGLVRGSPATFRGPIYSGAGGGSVGWVGWVGWVPGGAGVALAGG